MGRKKKNTSRQDVNKFNKFLIAISVDDKRDTIHTALVKLRSAMLSEGLREYFRTKNKNKFFYLLDKIDNQVVEKKIYDFLDSNKFI